MSTWVWVAKTKCTWESLYSPFTLHRSFRNFNSIQPFSISNSSTFDFFCSTIVATKTTYTWSWFDFHSNAPIDSIKRILSFMMSVRSSPVNASRLGQRPLHFITRRGLLNRDLRRRAQVLRLHFHWKTLLPRPKIWINASRNSMTPVHGSGRMSGVNTCTTVAQFPPLS